MDEECVGLEEIGRDPSLLCDGRSSSCREKLTICSRPGSQVLLINYRTLPDFSPHVLRPATLRSKNRRQLQSVCKDTTSFCPFKITSIYTLSATRSFLVLLSLIFLTAVMGLIETLDASPTGKQLVTVVIVLYVPSFPP